MKNKYSEPDPKQEKIMRGIVVTITIVMIMFLYFAKERTCAKYNKMLEERISP